MGSGVSLLPQKYNFFLIKELIWKKFNFFRDLRGTLPLQP